MLQYRAASGPNVTQWHTPNSTDLIGWSAGRATNVPRSTFALASHNQAWSTITSTPTTLSGYGITDAQGLDADLTAIAALAPSQGAIMIRGASGWTSLAAGTNGQVLTSSGTGADPTWTTITAGASLSTANQWTAQQSFNTASTTGAININPTWNASGSAFNGIYMRATNTASAAATNLIDLGLTSSMFRVSKDGYMFCAGGLEMGSSINQTRVANYSGSILFYASGTIGPMITSTELRLAKGYRLAITNATSYAGTTASVILGGSGSPEGAVTAPVGSLYLRADGGTSSSLYVKESGTGSTGWIAK